MKRCNIKALKPDDAAAAHPLHLRPDYYLGDAISSNASTLSPWSRGRQTPKLALMT
jgi:hypothetical protein